MSKSIKEVSESLHIPESSIRYYDQQRLLPFVARDKNGYRQFKEEDLFWLELVRCMRSTGMSISTLRHIAQLHMEGPDTLEEREQIFIEQKQRLFNEKQRIDEAVAKVDKKLDMLKEMKKKEAAKVSHA
ncbi:MerR family transcriptional regulator [Sporolactobacillus pectinivorans]|uniref:MerR family transcriptional regulator n=1 Tax=Sporolactobacillus pectinivorans TaxID=1591408 RepID=UPI000C2605B4|nr:MerR family transcriptional regulator [Sporolactobacillus pectinivorans]